MVSIAADIVVLLIAILHVYIPIEAELAQGDIDLPSTYTTAFVDAVPN
ncbi:MAG: hypothetical protein WCA24_12055 [Thiomonas sp.]